MSIQKESDTSRLVTKLNRVTISLCSGCLNPTVSPGGRGSNGGVLNPSNRRPNHSFSPSLYFPIIWDGDADVVAITGSIAGFRGIFP